MFNSPNSGIVSRKFEIGQKYMFCRLITYNDICIHRGIYTKGISTSEYREYNKQNHLGCFFRLQTPAIITLPEGDQLFDALTTDTIIIIPFLDVHVFPRNLFKDGCHGRDEGRPLHDPSPPLLQLILLMVSPLLRLAAPRPFMDGRICSSLTRPFYQVRNID